MSSPNILVSGAGIAAGAFSSWLLRAYPDANITIVERDPTLRLTGASVDIRSSAVDIIKWMGAEEEIRKHTTNEQGIEFVTADGKPIATFGATGRTDIQSFTSEFEIFRGALAEVFLRPVLEKVELILDERVDSYETHDDGVVVTFARSKEVKKYDLLVAADGLGSQIRGTMLDTKPREQIHNAGVYAAYFTIKRDMLDGGRLAKWFNDTKGRGVFLRPDPDPAGKTRGNLVNMTVGDEDETRQRLEAAMNEGHESYMQLLEELFSDAGWLAPEVLKGMRESDDFYCSIFAQVRSPKLQDRRVVLLGDAGYATPGIGTSLAIMGGYVLAGELLSRPGDIEAAAKAYEDIMMPFLKHMQKDMMAAMQMMNPQTAWGLSIRNAIMRFVGWIKLDRIVMSASAAIGFTEKKLDMPDYAWPAL